MSGPGESRPDFAHPLVEIRRATLDDCKLLWEWVNDPEVRMASFRTDVVAWEEHVAWFQDKLRDSDCLILIGTSAGGPVGQVRFDIRGARAVLSVSVARSFRGRGYGRAMVEGALEELFRTHEVEHVDAFVKPGNIRSAEFFRALQFRFMGQITMDDHPALWFRKTRGPLAPGWRGCN